MSRLSLHRPAGAAAGDSADSTWVRVVAEGLRVVAGARVARVGFGREFRAWQILAKLGSEIEEAGNAYNGFCRARRRRPRGIGVAGGVLGQPRGDRRCRNEG